MEDEIKRLQERYKACVMKFDRELEYEYPYCIMTDFGDEFPQFINCYEIAEIIRKAGVITRGVLEDHEHSCCYYNFKTKRSAERFCDRLGKFIAMRRQKARELGWR